ncbi:D-inositol-3-phosphate glycosyltransferase [Candidatus Gugararchaeum adminiculabundum]|nr:D-inositol-3-phosphate glycosyltransferase [Candidatus Gugararchaeum adminiculabundum]
MRIAFFTDTYLPNRDGVVASMTNFRGELEKRGHEVYVFTSGSEEAKKANKDPRVFFHRSTTFKPYPQYKVALFPFLSSAQKVRDLKIDVVHSHALATMAMAAIGASKAAHRPLVGTFHTMVSDAADFYLKDLNKHKRLSKISKGVTWGYLKFMFKQCTVATAPSECTGRILAEHGINAEIVPNGIDIQRFNPSVSGEEVRRKHGLAGRKVVLHLGRLALEKNLEVLIRSCLIVREEEPNVRFVVVGDGPARKYYEELVKKEGLESSFVFTGIVSDEMVPKYYAACDVLAFPSVFETQGLVALEAMACGKPVAAANKYALPEVVRNGEDGYLFEPSDETECAKKILQCMKEKNRLGKNGRKIAEEYDLKKCADKLEKIYERIVK